MPSQKVDRSVADPAHRLRFKIATLLWLIVVLDSLGTLFFFGISVALDDSASPPINLILAFAGSVAGPIILAAIASAGSRIFVSKQRYSLALWSLAGPLIGLLGLLAYFIVQFFLL